VDREGIAALNTLLSEEENNFLNPSLRVDYTCTLVVKAENGDTIHSRQVQPPLADAIGDIVESINAGAGHILSGPAASFQVVIQFEGRKLTGKEIRAMRTERKRARMQEESEAREEPIEGGDAAESGEPSGPDVVETDDAGSDAPPPIAGDPEEPKQPDEPKKRGRR